MISIASYQVSYENIFAIVIIWPLPWTWKSNRKKKKKIKRYVCALEFLPENCMHKRETKIEKMSIGDRERERENSVFFLQAFMAFNNILFCLLICIALHINCLLRYGKSLYR